jgi:hypothetical protein
MAEYALSLYFDDNTAAQLQLLIDTAKNACGNSYMTEPSVIPPHITFCYFKTESIDTVMPLIENEMVAVSQGDLCWVSLGAFSTAVLFAAPVFNEYLLDLCRQFNNLLIHHVELVDYYKPFSWMPHTTLATKLDKKQMVLAFDAAVARFNPFVGKTTHVNLARCERFTELKTWELQKKKTAK